MRRFATIVVLLATVGCGTGTSSQGEEDAGDTTTDTGDVDADATSMEADADDGECIPGETPPEARGWIAAGSLLAGIDLGPCVEHRWSLAGSSGSSLLVSVRATGTVPVELAIAWPDDQTWGSAMASATALAGAPASTVHLDPPRSGEFVVMVRAADPRAAGSYDLGVSCEAGCDAETTRYPIVLVHGWTGFDEIGPLTYFYGIPDLLSGMGYAVYVASLDPYNSVEVRSGQLAEQIDGFLDEGRALKVDLVAHSQGGLDSRRVISTLGYGDRVSALVTVATPHRGTPVADVALGYLPGPATDAMAFLLELIGAAGGSESDAEASFESLTTSEVVDVFNPANPDDPRVSYVSWTGLTCLTGIPCGDVCDIEIRWSYDLIYLLAGDNDGMVPVSSAIWGDYRGEVPADHFDEVGQLLGVTGPGFDHEEFYLGIARDLANEGH